MATIHIKKSHNQDMAHARTHADETVEALADKFGVKYQWDGDTVKFKGAGAKGYMSIDHGQVEVKMELSFMLRPFKSRIEDEINRHLVDFSS